MQGGRGLQGTLNHHAKKFVGVLNGIDTDAWNPSADKFLKFQYSAEKLEGKLENKNVIRKQLKLSSVDASRPLVNENISPNSKVVTCSLLANEWFLLCDDSFTWSHEAIIVLKNLLKMGNAS